MPCLPCALHEQILPHPAPCIKFKVIYGVSDLILRGKMALLRCGENAIPVSVEIRDLDGCTIRLIADSLLFPSFFERSDRQMMLL
jgi:hypothetical protein